MRATAHEKENNKDRVNTLTILPFLDFFRVPFKTLFERHRDREENGFGPPNNVFDVLGDTVAFFFG